MIIERIGPEEREFVLTRARLILDTPALRARLWQQERDTAAGSLTAGFEEAYRAKLNGDPTVSSTIIPNINGYQI
jgi:hypothetical protein